ncbi:MAG: proline dehydrogenase family protein [Actinomycetota bacterium]|nr:proline dehydrogenase family protein [Actinomycetota bacterium]
MSGSFSRGAVLRLTEHPLFRRLATSHAIGWRVASRFVAGESLQDVLQVARELRAQGIATMLDHLGENVRAPEHAAAAANAYVRALEAIGAESKQELDAAISIKLTQLGLDFSEDLCRSHVERVLSTAGSVNRLVMIDMEASEYVERTLALFRSYRARSERIGICLQASLKRTPSDVFSLPERSIVRLVKGAYLEPAEIALHRRDDVDRAFARLAATVLARGHTLHAATHDQRLVEGLRRLLDHGTAPASRIEFQMLYGIRRDLQVRLASAGYPVRIYVPYGTEWYPYLTRRLAERPANLWFFLSNLMRSGR